MPTAEAEAPLGDDELDALFAPFTASARIALAVSGGADSLALLDGIDRWRRRRGGRPLVLVLGVDHGLRPDSGDEAAAVARLARGRRMDGRVLVWEGPRPTADIEAAARAARYRLLIAAAKAAGASHLLLAHHREDQAETFLMRLARGSGVFGLAAMRREIALDGLVLARPFLEVPKARLVATVRAAGLTPVEDAMNSDPRFLRARMRRALPLLAGEGIDVAGIAETAERLAGAAQALDEWVARILAESATVDPLAFVRLDPDPWRAAPAEVRLRLLARLLIAVGGEPYPPRFARLAALARAMAAHGGGRFKRSLAGAIVEWRGGRFLVYRELGRQGLPVVAAGAGFAGVWDHRFHLAIGEEAPQRLTIAALGEAGRRAIGARAGAAPAGALAALPAIRRGEAIVAVPGIAYRAPRRCGFAVTQRALLADRLAKPPLFPEFEPDQ